MYNAESTNKHTPNDSNNVESNDFDVNRLLLFEHVRMQKDTEVLSSNNTRSHNLLVCKDDDASKGSDVFQPEETTRDVVNNIFGPMTCIVFHFQGSYYNQQYVLFLPLTLDD